MRIDVYVSGSLKIVHELPQGTSPLATLADLQAMENRLVALLDDKLAALQAAVTDSATSLAAATTRVQATVTDSNAKIADLNTQIADLKAIIAAGGSPPTQAQLDLLDSLVAQVAAQKTGTDAIDPSSPVVLPPTP